MSDAAKLRVRRVGGVEVALPSYQTPGSAGLDLRAAVARDLVIPAGGRAAVPTGLVVAVPPGHEGQIRARSGLAIRHGIIAANGVGTLDEDFRGELMVLLANLGAEPFTVRRGDRIAQLVVAPVTRVQVELVEALDATERGAGGFGSTGR